MWRQLSTPLDPRAYASFTLRFAITLLTACSSLIRNGPGLCTVPRRVRGEKTERQEDIPPKRPSSFRRYLGARRAASVLLPWETQCTAAPTPRPAKLKLLTGVSPGRDSGGRLVPTPPRFERAATEMPTWLDAEGRDEWKRIVPALDEHGIVKPSDRALLVCFCEAWSRFVHAVRMYQTEGITIVDPGQRMLAPSSGGRNRVGSRRAASQHRQRVRFVTGRRAFPEYHAARRRQPRPVRRRLADFSGRFRCRSGDLAGENGRPRRRIGAAPDGRWWGTRP
jgi:hypothetical protein